MTFRIQGEPDEWGVDGLQELANIVSTCPNRNVTDPLLAIVTNDDLEPVAVDGVRWIMCSWWFHQEYYSSESEHEEDDTDDGGDEDEGRDEEEEE